MTTDGSNTSTSLQAKRKEGSEALPQDLTVCHALIHQLLDARVEDARLIEGLQHELRNMLRRAYGRSSEKLDPNQLALFEKMLADLANAVSPAPAPELPAIPAAKPAPINGHAGHGRRQLPPELERRPVVIDLPEEQKPCPCCQTMREPMGDEITEKLDFEPARVFVRQEIRRKYVCHACEHAAAPTGPQIVIADKPLSPIEKGLAAPGLLAHMIVSKYGDHLPLTPAGTDPGTSRHSHRPLDHLRLDGAVCPGTRAALPVHGEGSAESRMHPHRRHAGGRAGSGTIPARPRPGGSGSTWEIQDHPQMVFDYTPSRSRDGPMEFLDGWGKDHRCILQADAFGGYDGIYRGEAGGQVTEVAFRSASPDESSTRPAYQRCGQPAPRRWRISGCSTMWKIRPRRSPHTKKTLGARPLKLVVRASASAARTLRAALGAISSMAGIPPDRPWRAGVAQESHGPGHHLRPKPMGRVVRLHQRRRLDIDNNVERACSPQNRGRSYQLGSSWAPTTADTPPPSSSASSPPANATRSIPLSTCGTCSPASRRTPAIVWRNSSPTAGKKPPPPLPFEISPSATMQLPPPWPSTQEVCLAGRIRPKAKAASKPVVYILHLMSSDQAFFSWSAVLSDFSTRSFPPASLAARSLSR